MQRLRERRVSAGLPPQDRDRLEAAFLANLAEQRSGLRRTFRSGGKVWRLRTPEQLVRTHAIEQACAVRLEQHVLLLTAWFLDHGYLTGPEAVAVARRFREIQGGR